MFDIKSLIILDLETTGLPCFDHNKTRITELSVIACEKSHLMISDELPRVLHKLVLCVNPQKKIYPTSSVISGLDNILLENVKPFGEDIVDCLKILIKRIPQPVCLVAHNGNKFDFPIIRKEILRCGADLPYGILCADSLLAFRQLYPRPQRPTKSVNPQRHSKGINNDLLDEEQDYLCLKALDECGNDSITKIITTPTKQRIQQINETTPRNKIFPQKRFRRLEEEFNSAELERLKIEREVKNEIQDVEDITLVMSKQSKDFLEEILDTPKRRIPAIDKNSTEHKELQNTSNFPNSYKLCDVYYFLHKRELENAHRAENDTTALLSCIVKSGENFFKWINQNAVPFREIEPIF